MPGSKKETAKKEKPKVQAKKATEKPAKKDPKFLTQQVEDRIKALAQNNGAEEDKSDKKEMHVTHEEETKKVTKDTASIVNANEEVTSEETQEAENKEHKEAHVHTKDEGEAEKENLEVEETSDDIPVVQSESLFARSIAPVIIGIFVGVLTAGSIIFFYNNQTGKSGNNVTPTPSVSETPTVVPSPTSSVVDDLTLYDITVLNGSGISGKAASVESFLEGKGFSVLEIGNAANSNFTTTIIQAKEAVPSGFIGKLQEALSESYSVSLNSVSLDEGEDSDVIVTIGSLAASESSASATPTP